MIDLHSHVLPEMDDGAKNIEEAKGLIHLLKSQGVSLLVLTPHFYTNLETMDDFIQRREAAFNIIKNCDIELRLASETYLTEALFSYDDIEALCIQGTRFLLLELPYSKEWGIRVYKMIEKVMGKYGVEPIIAHIERYEAVNCNRNKESILNELVEIGCLLQMNAESVVNKYTRSSSLKLIKNGWIDVIGSDCHNLTTRPPQYDQFKEIMINKLGKEYLIDFERNARDLLSNT